MSETKSVRKAEQGYFGYRKGEHHLTAPSVFEGEAKLFDHRVGQDLAGDPSDFGLRFRAAQAAVEGQLKVFTLADLVQTLVTHLLKRTVDRLALRIQNAFFQ